MSCCKAVMTLKVITTDVSNNNTTCCCSYVKTARFNPIMRIQKGNAQRPSLMPSDEIWQLQLEMARLTAHISKLIAQQQSPAPGNPRPLAQPSVQVQNISGHPSGAHLQMCSFHGHCTYKEVNCQAQRPNSPHPSNPVAANAGHCYFC
uniref:Uncharacterized protein n=1 Tax=Romanomermis culicivorax TaxID=13658 RepID=A0A915I6G0_ROMCU